jgi:hypothetical protein
VRSGARTLLKRGKESPLARDAAAGAEHRLHQHRREIACILGDQPARALSVIILAEDEVMRHIGR